MPMQGRRGTVRNRPYSIRGSTLEELNTAIARSGPADLNDGQRRAGACSGTLVVAIGGRDLAFESAQEGRRWRSTCTVTGGTVSANCTIVMPNLSGGSLTATAQREWDRFLAAVETHETGHIDEYVVEAQAVAQELSRLSAEGEGRDQRAAESAARSAFSQEMGRQFDLVARANAAAARYDARNRHGETQGAHLDATIA